MALVALALAACAPAAVTAGPDTECVAGRRIITGELTNGRDLGGLTLGGGGATRCGHVYRSAVLSQLTDTGCAQFASLGIKTVVDLREPSERQSVPNVSCLQPQARVVTAPMPIPYRVSAADYLADLRADASVKQLFDLLGDDANDPLLLHCTYGRDRSGVAAALVLLVLGVSREEIRADYRRTADSGLAITPASLEATLDELDRLGGAEAHLTSIGVSASSLAALRARLSSQPEP